MIDWMNLLKAVGIVAAAVAITGMVVAGAKWAEKGDRNEVIFAVAFLSSLVAIAYWMIS